MAQMRLTPTDDTVRESLPATVATDVRLIEAASTETNTNRETVAGVVLEMFPPTSLPTMGTTETADIALDPAVRIIPSRWTTSQRA
jgi:hypothetical protein